MSKKSMYSTDFVWYDKSVYNAIVALNEEHNNAIAVFGGALSAYECINSDEPNIEKFVAYLPSIASNAKFYKWHEGIVGALHRFCHLCLIDPYLIELYLGMSLDELCTHSHHKY